LNNVIYSRSYRFEKDALKKTNKYIKLFNCSNDNNVFCKKWNFTTEFYVMEKKDSLANNNNIFTNNNSNILTDKISINEIITKYAYLLVSILITFYCFSEVFDIKKLELILNESYSHEYQFYFKKYFYKKLPSFFHLLNFIKNKDNIQSLNIELNSLDSEISQKLFYLIYKNNSLTELQISFFTSSISYTQQAIYKLYLQYNNFKRENKMYYLEEPEKEMLNTFYDYFETNLNILFDIITKKTNLTKLGLFFEVPSILINNQKYMILILKFIINIFFFN
jgi:hypothetical protein